MTWDKLEKVSTTSTVPISIFELTSWLRIDASDENQLLSDLISDAIDYIEGPHGFGIVLSSQQWKLRLNCFPSVISIPLFPVTSIDSITYLDSSEVTQTLADYQSDVYSSPARIIPVYGGTFPIPGNYLNNVTVTFTAGYSTMPGDLRRAIVLLVGHWFENRTASAEQMYEIPFGVNHVLNKYRVGRFG